MFYIKSMRPLSGRAAVFGPMNWTLQNIKTNIPRRWECALKAAPYKTPHPVEACFSWLVLRSKTETITYQMSLRYIAQLKQCLQNPKRDPDVRQDDGQVHRLRKFGVSF